VTGSASLSRAAGETVAGGPYTITPTIGTLAASNYDFTTFTTGAFTIDKAHLTVTADAKSKTYGAADPSLTATISGFVNSEVLGTSGVTGSASLSRAAGETVAGGPYTITPTIGTLAASNYDFTTFTTGAFTIDPYTLAVIADAQSKTAGAVDPVLTYTYGTLQNGDNAGVFSGALTRAAGETAAGGPYAITQGTLDAGSNYSISYTGADLTILAASDSAQREVILDTTIRQQAYYYYRYFYRGHEDYNGVMPPVYPSSFGKEEPLILDYYPSYSMLLSSIVHNG